MKNTKKWQLTRSKTDKPNVEGNLNMAIEKVTNKKILIRTLTRRLQSGNTVKAGV